MIAPAAKALFIVVDSAENRENLFWTEYIGTLGVVKAVGVDGLLDVLMADGNLVEGVRLSRILCFDPLPVVKTRKRRPWWAFWRKV